MIVCVLTWLGHHHWRNLDEVVEIQVCTIEGNPLSFSNEEASGTLERPRRGQGWPGEGRGCRAVAWGNRAKPRRGLRTSVGDLEGQWGDRGSAPVP